MKIIEITATRWHILKLKTLPRPLAGFQGTTSKGRQGRGEDMEEGRGGEEMERKDREKWVYF